jgi:2-keto-4-pentenoate hydratase/2-oxohepta-3-ene-1,7-dioic acid hydratase in catechol pathway
MTGANVPNTEPDFGDVAKLDMRIANIRTAEGYGLGVESAHGVMDVSATAGAFDLPVPSDVDALLSGGLARQLRAVMHAAAEKPGVAVLLDPAQVRFAPLVTRPKKIICVGFNYRKHAQETNTPIPKEPPLFSKFSNALNNHGGTIRLPTDIDDRFDFETELVILFGKRARRVSESDALDYVAGYATGNDFSARTRQTATTQFLAGKASDGFAPLGPWLVTRDRVSDPNNLRILTHVNGQKRQDWNTRDMIFNCRQLIAFVTSIMTIEAGDILFTGTPQGVIFGEKAPPEQRRWLRAGDSIVSELEGLGELRFMLE